MGCLASAHASEVSIDFESAKPVEDEVKVYKEADEVLKDSDNVLRQIDEYKGCRELVRQAMSEPSAEHERAAFEGLLVAVDSISLFFELGRQMERILPMMYHLLAPSRPRDDGRHPLLVYQATGREFASLLDLVIRFDQTRMMRPNLSNDFSYYRRLLPKFAKHPDVKVKDDEASGMALFTAEHMPMMSTLAKVTKNYSESSDAHDGVCSLLSTLANSCMRLAKAKRFKPELNLLCVRAMTGCIVLYDHLEQKAFSKKSPIAIRECIGVLKTSFDRKETEGLLNSIRYSTVSFRSAPTSIQELFD